MTPTNTMLAFVLAYYLHQLPYFRGKWRLLRPLAGIVNGTPVSTRYDGVRLVLDVGDRTNELCVLGRYEDIVPDEVGQLAAGTCFVDVGANCGLFSVMAGKQVGAAGLVVAFEPCLQTYVKLVQNIAANALQNVVPFNLAIGERSERIALDVSSAGHSGRFSIATDGDRETAMITSVQLRDKGKIVDLIGSRPTVVKIDVEGFELSALRGLAPILARSETYRVIAEIDDANLGRYGARPEDVYDLLAGHGFAPRFGLRCDAHYDEVFSRPAEL